MTSRAHIVLVLGLLAASSLFGACDCLGDFESAASYGYVGTSPIEFTEPTACASPGRVTYGNTIGAIMARHCLSCHSPSEQPASNGAWSSLTQGDLSSWSSFYPNLAEVCAEVAAGTMPPPRSQDPLSQAEYDRFGDFCDRAGYPFIPEPPATLDRSAVESLARTSAYRCVTCHNTSANAPNFVVNTSSNGVSNTEANLACIRVASGEMPRGSPALTESQRAAFATACGDSYDFELGDEGPSSGELFGYVTPRMTFDARVASGAVVADYAIYVPASVAPAVPIDVTSEQVAPSSLQILSDPRIEAPEYSVDFFYDEDHSGFDGTRFNTQCAAIVNNGSNQITGRVTSRTSVPLGSIPYRIGHSNRYYIYGCVGDGDNVYCQYDHTPITTTVTTATQQTKTAPTTMW